LKIKGLMPVYLEKLEMTATKKSARFEVALALSLDSLTLWGSTNYPGDIVANIQLKSIPKKVLGTEDVAVTVKGEFKNHLAKFNRMILTQGSKFLPGEYTVHVVAKETHFLNRNFRSLSGIAFFKSLNKTYTFDDTTLVYPGTPREFDKRLEEYSNSILGEMLKPYQDKLERVQTFESILNATSQNFLMELEKAKKGSDITHFETKFIKEISPLLQTLVVKASELSKDPSINEEDRSKQVVAPYREQVLLGKQIGEMASDMITKTTKIKKLTDKEKSALKIEFDKRAKAIKLQIDMNVKKIEEQIQKISK
jgi:molybdopterin-biosynthesis enzyme MoeA-like protein